MPVDIHTNRIYNLQHVNIQYNQIFFSLSGDATIVGVDNGSQTSMERFKANHRKAFFGKCLVVVQAGKTQDNVCLRAQAADLKAAEIKLTTKQTNNLIQ